MDPPLYHPPDLHQGQDHTLIQFLPKIEDCIFCNQTMQVTDLPGHFSSKHPEEMFVCLAGLAPCHQMFVKVTDLQQHLSSEHGISTFVCDKLVRSGLISLPSKLKMMRCKMCSTIFTFRSMHRTKWSKGVGERTLKRNIQNITFLMT